MKKEIDEFLNSLPIDNHIKTLAIELDVKFPSDMGTMRRPRIAWLAKELAKTKPKCLLKCPHATRLYMDRNRRLRDLITWMTAMDSLTCEENRVLSMNRWTASNQEFDAQKTEQDNIYETERCN